MQQDAASVHSVVARFGRRSAYFVLIALVIVLIKTTAVGYLATALIGPGAGRDIQQAADSSVSGLFLALLVSIYLEVVRERTHENRLAEISSQLASEVDRLRADGRGEVLGTTPPHVLLQAALTRVYDDVESDVDGLVDAIVGGQRSVYRAVEVDYELADSPDTDDRTALQLTIRTRMTLRGVNELMIAFVVDESLIGSIYGTCPFIHDFWWVRNVSSLREAVSGMESGHVMRVIRSPAEGGVFPLAFTQIPPSEYKTYGDGIARSVLEADPDQFALMKAPLPPGPQATTLTIVRSHVSLSVGRCYWMTDRPTQLNRLSFDWSRLTVGKDLEFSLVPFFTVRDVPSKPAHGLRRLEIDINQWVLGGQGAILFWSRPGDPETRRNSVVTPMASP